MNLKNRLKRLERELGAPGECPVCRGFGAPLGRAEFHNGDPPVEFGACPRCKGVGSRGPGTKLYCLPSRKFFDSV